MNLIAKGNTAEVYAYRDDLVCKLFYPRYPRVYVEHEFKNANAVFRLGIRTPQAHAIIFLEGRYGIIYDRVDGKELSSLIHCADESVQATWIDRFVDFHKELIGHTFNDGVNYKDFLRLFTADSMEILGKIHALEDGHALLHGDFHPSNILVSSTEELVVVDMMNICKGPGIYDIARTYFLLENNKKLQSRYLEKMGYPLAEITPYLEVISMLREKETKLIFKSSAQLA